MYLEMWNVDTKIKEEYKKYIKYFHKPVNFPRKLYKLHKYQPLLRHHNALETSDLAFYLTKSANRASFFVLYFGAEPV